MQTQPIILFDGACGLCTWSVQFIIQHDTSNLFKIINLQSADGKRLISKFNIDTDKIDSVILIEDSQYLIKSSAVLRIIQVLYAPRAIISILGNIPVSIRDWCYDIIARNRYKWFGKVEHCPVSINEED
jgi:predicted DCC family thiol-disulfide oxidoreductase YuxK